MTQHPGSETNLGDVVAAIHGLKADHGGLLREILAQAKATNGRVLKLEAAEIERTQLAALKAKLVAEGWQDPEHTWQPVEPAASPAGMITWRQLGVGAAGIGVVLAGLATGVAKALGL